MTQRLAGWVMVLVAGTGAFAFGAEGGRARAVRRSDEDDRRGHRGRRGSRRLGVVRRGQDAAGARAAGAGLHPARAASPRAARCRPDEPRGPWPPWTCSTSPCRRPRSMRRPSPPPWRTSPAPATRATPSIARATCAAATASGPRPAESSIRRGCAPDPGVRLRGPHCAALAEARCARLAPAAPALPSEGAAPLCRADSYAARGSNARKRRGLSTRILWIVSSGTPK